jgi:hypothetical protein
MIFNHSKFEEQVNLMAPGYNLLSPYPYAIFDDLFDESLVNKVNGEIGLA